MTRLRLLALLALCAFVIVGAWAALPAEAQCSPRTDWGTYTVVRGDTLSRIARANNTTVAALVQGNCLTTTAIRWGQTLRVPGAATPLPPPLVQPPGGTFGSSATYLPFENGFMVYRYDQGPIYVFSNTNNSARSYPLSQWGNLTIPTNPTDQPPVGRFRPDRGFGRLWHNVPEVRLAVGWATQALETGYNTFFNTPSFGNFFTLSLPDGRTVRIDPTLGTWNMVTSTATMTATGQPSFSTGATFAAFERGFMVWRADTGEIRVYVGDGARGQLTIITSSAYATLPLIGGFTAPEGLRVPTGGFGRVWRNDAGLRVALGYERGGEQGYTMALIGSATSPAGFSLPDGRVLYGPAGGGDWSFGDQPPVSTPPPITTIPPSVTPGPSLTPSPTASATTIGNVPGPTTALFGATYQPFEGGFMLWRADTGDIWVYIGGASGEIAVIPASVYGGLSIDRSAPPPAGRIRPDNGFGRVWSNYNGLRGRLGWATSSEQGYVMEVVRAVNLDTTRFRIPDGRFVVQGSGTQWNIEGPPPTPFPSPTAPSVIQRAVSFQEFEGGFMLWLSDNGSIWVFIQSLGQVYLYESAGYATLPIDRETPPPLGRVRPDNGFGRVWSNFPDVRARLGWALQPELGYVSTWTFRPDFAVQSVTLPGGGAILENVGGNNAWRVTGMSFTGVGIAPDLAATESALATQAMANPIATAAMPAPQVTVVVVTIIPPTPTAAGP
jgi:LysM repeat protein